MTLEEIRESYKLMGNKKTPQASEAGDGKAQAGAQIMDSGACKGPFQKRWEEFYAPRLGPNAEQELHQLCSRMHGEILQGDPITSPYIEND